MNINKKLLRDCVAESYRRVHRHDQKFKHYSFIYQNNDLLSIGLNCSHDNLVYHRGTRHSEYSAYQRAYKRIRMGRFTCINIRIGNDYSLRLSKPCQRCWNFLRQVGCSECIYTIDSNTWGEIKIYG